PTDTGSTCTGPTSSSACMTASKIGRSRSGPVEKYSSSDIAGAHSCDCPLRPNWRPHFSHTHAGTVRGLLLDEHHAVALGVGDGRDGGAAGDVEGLEHDGATE